MNCIIIEDQPPAQRILKKFIQDLGTLTLKGTFPDAMQALECLRVTDIDLMFLDIHLPKMSGLDFLKTLHKPPFIILTTAFSDYALESYEYNVVDYLLKPFSFQRFVKAVARVQAHQAPDLPGPATAEPNLTQANSLYIKSGHAYVRIHPTDIRYIKSDADYTEIHTRDKRHLSSESLRYWIEHLDPLVYVQVHKSFIVNTLKIEKLMGNQLFLEGGEAIPLGRAYKEHFVEKYIKQG